MIYLRVKPRVNARVGDPLTLSVVADLLADASLGLNAIPVELPRGEGIWPLARAAPCPSNTALCAAGDGQRARRWHGLAASRTP